MSFNPKLDNNCIKEVNNGLIYPVYINSRVTRELIDFCKSTVPKEALGFLLGTRVLYIDDARLEFTKITDWVTGSVDSTHISASFTTEGLEQANRYLDDKFGLHREQNDEIPKIVGIVHSHPFNFEPDFSQTDLNTFLNFPYDTEGNVFILIDPIPQIPYFKVFKLMKNIKLEKILQHVPWIEYSPIKSDLTYTNYSELVENKSVIYQKSETEQINQKKDDPYRPPKIENLKENQDKETKKKVNLREFF